LVSSALATPKGIDANARAVLPARAKERRMECCIK
jgi:hypothetical protein